METHNNIDKSNIDLSPASDSERTESELMLPEELPQTYAEERFILNVEGIQRFLGSGRIEGIGPVYAGRIVDRFGEDSLRIITETPERLAEISGLGETRIKRAVESIKSLSCPLDLLALFYASGISELFIDRILGKYRVRARERVFSDPYSMVEDVWQLSFFTADKIGKQLGIASDDPRRLRAALVTAVKRYSEAGHLFAAIEEAVESAAQISGCEPEKIRREIGKVVEEGRLIESRGALYIPVFYKAEKKGALKLAELAAAPVVKVEDEEMPDTTLRGNKFTPTQREAMRMVLESPVAVITGGPGSGKTTVLKGIINVLEKEGKKVILAAPTGRAAKRMSTLTGHEAMTIHRLLGYRQGEGYHNPAIEADVLIIDEGSMMEQVLFNHLLQAIRPNTRIILVGDADQLPAIGAGDVLRDMIESGRIPVARLNENFRQTEGSLIAVGAKSINSGEVPHSDPDGDFVIVEEKGPKAIHDRIISLMTEELPAKQGIAPSDIVVVTPQQIGMLGARQLNVDLQRSINPEGPELRRGATIMRLGDPVMQTSNSRERGVYNGEVGKITEVDPSRQCLTVTFADGRSSEYQRSELSELTLAYATTVHKLQGSEVDYMIFPVTMAHKPMLYRNLLYTGVSRASRLCVLVGESEAISYAVGHSPDATRNSNFKYRLRDNIPQLPPPEKKSEQ